MHEAIERMLARYTCVTANDYINALREILQEVALLGLWRSKFFEHAAFYGGSALRILYGLDRYSEDMDFSLLSPDNSFQLDKYLIPLEKEIRSFGFDITVEKKKKQSQSTIQSAFLKANTVKEVLIISPIDFSLTGIHKHQRLKIKVEIDVNPPSHFATEMKYNLHPISFPVKTYQLPDMFAGKMHAILCRKWANRVKGRDWYDLVWYISNHPTIHLYHLEKRLRNSGHWDGNKTLSEKNFFHMIWEATEQLDIQMAVKDIENFIQDKNSISVWSKDFFKDIIQKIQFL